MENYLCRRQVLLDFAEAEGARHGGALFGQAWRRQMEESIAAIEQALDTLGEPSPWGPDIKASDAFLGRLFRHFYGRLKLPNLMEKTNYHRLAGHLSPDAIDPEVAEKLDAIAAVAARARRGAG